VKGNANAIGDAVRNLVENGITHSPPRTEVMVSTHVAGCVSVADQGPGVPAKDRQRIFQRFWRGRAVMSQGAGLGLAIVTEIMKVHSGSVKVVDGPRGGAVFTLRFPLADPEMHKTKIRSEPGSFVPPKTRISA
jgi:signal transduction histidine kinase